MNLKPLSIWKTLVLFLAPTLFLWWILRFVYPHVGQMHQGPSVVNWFVAGGFFFSTLFFGAFVFYFVEQKKITLKGFKERIRLTPMSKSDWSQTWLTLWKCIGVTVVVLLVWKLIAANVSFIPDPSTTPELLKMEPVTLSTAWILIAWLPLFFFNIVGEELWWRGMIQPRQELEHHQYAWLVHGAALTMFHLPFGLNMALIFIPTLFAIPYAVEKTKSLWSGLVLHAIMNGGGFLSIAFGVG